MDPSALTVNIERTGVTQQLVKGEVAWPEVKTKMDQAFRELSKEVRLKGFRRGKVPRGLLDKMLGGKVREEVAKNLVNEALADIIGTHRLRVVAPPSEWDITNWGIKTEEPLRFEARMEVLPQVEPEDYFGVELDEQPVEVSDEEIEGFIRNKQIQMTEYRTIEGRTVVAEGDVVKCDIMGKVGDEPVDWQKLNVPVPKKDEPVHAPGREPLPGLARALIGVDTASGDAELDLSFGEDAPESIRDKKAHLLVSFETLQEPVVPAIDDDFARDTGEADTLAEYRAHVRLQLEENAKEGAKKKLRTQLLAGIRERNPVELSLRLVREEMERIKGRLGMTLGFDVSDILQKDNNLEESLRSQASEEVHNALLLDAISTKEAVEITDADVEEYIETTAKQTGENPSRIKANLEKTGLLASLKLTLREARTVDLLLERAHVKKIGEEPSKPGTGKKAADSKALEARATKKTAQKTTKKTPAAQRATKKTPKKTPRKTPRKTAEKTTKKTGTAKKTSNKTSNKTAKKTSKKTSKKTTKKSK